MIGVEFKSVGPGMCSWCRRDRDVYSVVFSDKSFVGNLCRNDLLRAIGLKVTPTEPDKKHLAPPVGNSIVASK